LFVKKLSEVLTIKTLGIDIENLSPGRSYVVNMPSLVYFASRLAHWLPAGYRMQRDLPRTEQLALMSGGNRGNRSIDATQFVAASIRVFAENFLRNNRFGETRVGNRRVLKEEIGNRFNMIAKWQNRMNQFIRQDIAFTITPTVTRLVPSFTRAMMPFFDIRDDWRSIPEGHLILSEKKGTENFYIDIGPS
jgi:hypothetical protein